MTQDDLADDSATKDDENKSIGDNQESSTPRVSNASNTGLLRRILDRINLGIILGVLGALIGLFGIWYAVQLSTGTDELIIQSKKELSEEIMAVLQSEGHGLPRSVRLSRAESLRAFLNDASETEAQALEKAFSPDPKVRSDALENLQNLARQQANSIDKMRVQAASTLKAIGSAAFLSDTDLAIQSFNEALSLVPSSPSVLNQLGALYLRRGDWSSGQAVYRRLMKEFGSDSLTWNVVALTGLGNLAAGHGDWDTAHQHFEQGLGLSKQLQHGENTATLYLNLSIVEGARGNPEQGEKYARLSLSLYEALNNKIGIANALNSVGEIERGRGNLDLAQDMQKRSYALNEELNNKVGKGGNLNNLAAIEFARGNVSEATGYLLEALEVFTALGDKPSSLTAFDNLGISELAGGNHVAAQSYFSQALSLAKELGDERGMVRGLKGLGQVEIKLGNFEAARTAFTKSLEYLKSPYLRNERAAVLYDLGRVTSALGNDEERCDHWKEAHDLLEKPGNTINLNIVSRGLVEFCPLQ